MEDNRTNVLGGALLREVNDRIAEIEWSDDEPLTLLCECGDDHCVEHVAMSRRQFAEIRETDRVVLAQTHRVAAD